MDENEVISQMNQFREKTMAEWAEYWYGKLGVLGGLGEAPITAAQVAIQDRAAQYERLKLVMTPEAAQAFQKPRCADCGKPLQGDEQSQETMDGALCESCLEDHGGGVTCYNPLLNTVFAEKMIQRQLQKEDMEHEKRMAELDKIKPVCICCTDQMLGVRNLDDVGDVYYIRHEDPCQFSHTERWMLPKAKAMFRAAQERKHEENLGRAERERQLRRLVEWENILHANGEDAVGRRKGMYRQALAGEVRG